MYSTNSLPLLSLDYISVYVSLSSFRFLTLVVPVCVTNDLETCPGRWLLYVVCVCLLRSGQYCRQSSGGGGGGEDSVW
jgi:hypothetical protein